MALPIWGLYMRGAYENETLGISQEEFLAPEVISIPLDCEEYENETDPNVPAKPKANLDALGF
jgi:penicillin-binding protein 1A